MRLNCGETAIERLARLGKWHRFFAWRPVQVGTNDYRWLEIVERRYVRYNRWEYRTASFEGLLP